MSARKTAPQKGAPLFFEGHEYEFFAVESNGCWTFRRPEGSKAPAKFVTVNPDEVERATGSALAPAAEADRTDWLRRLPPVPPQPERQSAEEQKARKAGLTRRKAFLDKVGRVAGEAADKLKASPSRQFYHLVAENPLTEEVEPTRIIEPPVERTFIRVPKGGSGRGAAPVAAAGPGALTITQTPPRGEKAEG